MGKFVVRLIEGLSGRVLGTEDEVFDSEAEAQAYADECNLAFAEGAEVLELAGRDFASPDAAEYVVGRA